MRSYHGPGGPAPAAWRAQAAWRLVYAACLAAGSIFLAASIYQVGPAGRALLDAHAYWVAGLTGPYAHWHAGSVDAFLYSPVAAAALAPLGRFSWPAFAALWELSMLAAALWLLAPLPLRWRVPLLLLTAPEFASGNIHLFLAVAIALGLRFPGSWALVLLTKVSPGVGLLWFVVRGEWKKLATALGWTLALRASRTLQHPPSGPSDFISGSPITTWPGAVTGAFP